MITLLDKNSYDVGGYEVTVRGINSDDFSKIESICSDMNRKVKDKILDLSQDPDFTSAFDKAKNNEELTDAEKRAMIKFSSTTSELDFTLDECKELLSNYDCIISVKQNDEDVDIKEFIDAVMQVPKYLKVFGNLIYTEYKESIELPDVKKK